MLIDVKDGIFEVNTSDSYNKEIYIIDNNLIIPYINLQIFEIKFDNPKIKRYDKLDFSYLIFKNVKEIVWNYKFNNEVKYGQLIFDDTSAKNDYLTEYINATNLFIDDYGYDFEIRFKEQYLYFSVDVNIIKQGLGFWFPIENPNFGKNMDDEKVQSFFYKESIPNEVLQLVGASDSAILETLRISPFAQSLPSSAKSSKVP
jgi:hypothetical protein